MKRLRLGPGDKLDEGRVDLGPRREGRRGKREENAGRGAPLSNHRKPAIVFAAGRGHDPFGELALKHQHHAVEPGRPGVALQPGDEEGRGDAIGQVGDDAHGGGKRKRGVVEILCIGGNNIETPRIERGDGFERRQTAPVLFYGDDARGAFEEQGAGEAAGTRPDLDDCDPFERPRRAGDAPGQIEIEQEVLPEAFLCRQSERADDLAKRRQSVRCAHAPRLCARAHGGGEAQRLDETARACLPVPARANAVP